MCGLAGFCISPEHADNITSDMLYDAIHVGIERNLHRGRDAVGFFLTAPEDNKNSLWYYKVPGEGKEHYKDIKKYIQTGIAKPTVLGIHTRGASSGFTADNNDNNHPVIYNDVMVIHNGMIRNHHTIKNKRDLFRDDHTYDKGAPLVDSLKIAMLLDNIADPVANPKDIAAALTELKGGFAFHAVWSTHPELSLLVAGPEYPLTVRFGKGRLGYSSEPEAVTEMFEKLNMPWSKIGKVREMDTGTFMLLAEGEAVYYGKYDSEKSDYEKRLRKAGWSGSGVNWKRHVPISSDVELEFIGSATRKTVAGHPKEIEGFWSSTVVPPEKLKTIYDKSVGLIKNDDTKDIWNALSTTHNFFTFEDGDPIDKVMKKQVLESLAEADIIYAVKVSHNDSILYGWFDEFELAVTDIASIIGAYDWSRGKAKRFTTESEVDEVKKQSIAESIKDYTPLLEVNTTIGGLSAWIMANSIDAKESKKTGVIGGQPMSGVSRGPLVPVPNQSSTTTTATSIGAGSTFKYGNSSNVKAAAEFCKRQLEDLGGVFPSGDNVLHLPVFQLYDWVAQPDFEEPDQDFQYHKEHADRMVFYDWDYCPTHMVELHAHDNPMDCEYTLATALVTAARMKNVTALEKTYQPKIRITTEFKGVNLSMWEDCEHKWKVEEIIDIPLWGVPLTIPASDTCTQCGVIRRVTRWPNFILDYMLEVSNKLVGGDWS